jgi:hypothetical protein
VDSICQAVQPFAPVEHDRIPPLKHSIAPAWQPFVQQAPALQAPFVQFIDVIW